MVPYVGHRMWGAVPFVQDARGTAATGPVLGLVPALLAGTAAFDPGPLHRTALATGVLALALGVVAAWTESGLLLAAFMVAILVTWLLGTLIHTEARPAARREGRVHTHA